MQAVLTSQDTRVKPRKPVVEQLLPQVVVQRLLRAIVWLVPVSSRPITLVERKGHRLALARTSRCRLRTRRASLWGVENSLISLHAHETFRAARDLYCHDRYLAYP